MRGFAEGLRTAREAQELPQARAQRQIDVLRASGVSEEDANLVASGVTTLEDIRERQKSEGQALARERFFSGGRNNIRDFVEGGYDASDYRYFTPVGSKFNAREAVTRIIKGDATTEPVDTSGVANPREAYGWVDRLQANVLTPLTAAFGAEKGKLAFSETNRAEIETRHLGKEIHNAFVGELAATGRLLADQHKMTKEDIPGLSDRWMSEFNALENYKKVADRLKTQQTIIKSLLDDQNSELNASSIEKLKANFARVTIVKHKVEDTLRNFNSPGSDSGDFYSAPEFSDYSNDQEEAIDKFLFQD
jgi:hypothetical protein